MTDVTFKSFVIGELYIFIILQKKKISGRANLKNNFVYFLHVWEIETGEKLQLTFYYRRVRRRFNRSSAIDGYFIFDYFSQNAAAGLRTHVTFCNIESKLS